MNEKLTRSKTYLLPALVKHYNLPKQEIISFFLGIKGEAKQTKYLVYIWVKKDEGFTDYITRLDFDKDILLAYRFPDEDLYDKIMAGKFSKLDKFQKNTIIDHFNFKKENKVVQVLYRSPYLRESLEKHIGMKLPPDVELGDIIEYENELYNPALSRD